MVIRSVEGQIVNHSKTRPKVYRCDTRSAAITAMDFEDSDSMDSDP